MIGCFFLPSILSNHADNQRWIKIYQSQPTCRHPLCVEVKFCFLIGQLRLLTIVKMSSVCVLLKVMYNPPPPLIRWIILTIKTCSLWWLSKILPSWVYKEVQHVSPSSWHIFLSFSCSCTPIHGLVVLDPIELFTVCCNF